MGATGEYRATGRSATGISNLAFLRAGDHRPVHLVAEAAHAPVPEADRLVPAHDDRTRARFQLAQHDRVLVSDSDRDHDGQRRGHLVPVGEQSGLSPDRFAGAAAAAAARPRRRRRRRTERTSRAGERGRRRRGRGPNAVRTRRRCATRPPGGGPRGSGAAGAGDRFRPSSIGSGLAPSSRCRPGACCRCGCRIARAGRWRSRSPTVRTGTRSPDRT